MNPRLVTIMGGTAAVAALVTYVAFFEGTVYRGYLDPIGIVTACTGHTETAEMRPYSEEECKTLLEGDLITHAEGAMKCVDFNKLTEGQRVAVVSFTFNVGTGRFCMSTFAAKLRNQDPTACTELLRWTFAGDKQLPGLVKRRKIEKEICEGRYGNPLANRPPSHLGCVQGGAGT